MSIYIDRKYLGTVSHRLERFTQKNKDLFNFRCPYCGDSTKNKLKARGYIYCKGNDYFYRCHNCSVSTSFSNFLKQVDQSVYKQYTIERYAAGDNGHSNFKKPTFDELKGNAFARFSTQKAIPLINLKNISELEDGHYAREYIIQRAIPGDRWSDIYYTDNFSDFLCREFPNHGKEYLPEDDRIVLVYKDEEGNITNIAGRALSDTKLRYITIKILEGKKIYGLEKVNKKNTVYITEGQFDSCFLDNAVAAGDSGLCSVADYFADKVDVVLVYDNEPRNKEIVKTLANSIELGYNVVIWPSGITQKDINDMVLAGVDVKVVVKQRTYNGSRAMMEFINWKRC